MLQKNEDNERQRSFSRRTLLLGGAQALLLSSVFPDSIMRLPLAPLNWARS
jgi:hypothetical protein